LPTLGIKNLRTGTKRQWAAGIMIHDCPTSLSSHHRPNAIRVCGLSMGSPAAFRLYNELERLRAENRVLLEEKMHKDDLIVELQAEVERLRRVLAIIADNKFVMKENDMRDFAREAIGPRGNNPKDE
jgi:hypothetical protein